MVGESFHNNPRDPIEERFARLEEQVTDISRNMFLGCAGVIFLKRYKPETQLSILGPRRGHALKNDQEQLALIPLIQIIFGMK
jgi:hypothetical protein